MNIEERVERLERLEKLRYNLKGLLFGEWDATIVAKDLKLKNISSFKETKETIECAITIIQDSI